MARAAVFCMELPGHFDRLRPIVEGLSARGVDVHVFTHARFAEQLHEATFVDVFEGRDVDTTTVPRGSRWVTFAGEHADGIIDDVRRLGATLIVHDAFALIGRVVAKALGLPSVSLCAGHNVSAASRDTIVEHFPDAVLTQRGEAAFRVLRERYGIADAGPYCYLADPDATLNICCEPPEFLTADERAKFGDVEFFGSVRERPIEERERDLVYVSFGTVAWRYFRDRAVETLRAIADTLAGQRFVISLGGWEDPGGIPNTETWVDQWEVLQRARLFITHHGLKSTHEAVYHRVPMVSYPLFADQPGLARRCQELGLAVPLEDMASLDRDAMLARLETAREWELRTIAGRSAVLDRIAAMA